MYEKPFKPRYQTSQSASGPRVVMPPRRRIFIILFLCAWLGGWYFGETSAINEIMNPKKGEDHGFLIIWLAGWTLGGLWALTCVLWLLVGREVLEISANALWYRIEIAGIGMTRIYSMNEIRDLRVSVADNNTQ